ELLIGNSHAADAAQRLGIPLLRAGFPLYDQLGGYQRAWIGYRGARQALFDIANLLLSHGHGGVAPYHSFYSHKDDHRWGTTAHGIEPALVDCERRR
ncbi:MAG: hypothetical protein LM522_08005, partial [Candidatus Contendobacter sp.]|nr:hypothetical protein [Candidatus Contendobacter sp.]